MFVTETGEMVDQFVNLNYDDIVTPIKLENYRRLLIEMNYDEKEMEFLTQGFTHGFSLGYSGNMKRKDFAHNLPFTVGDLFDMWQKIMKEVKLGRVARPFNKRDIPYQYFVQSPIGLVPKFGGQTRLIFHLSYNFKNGNPSINSCIPCELCTTKYNDLNHVVCNCTQLNSKVYWAKTDVQMAFRIVPIKPLHRCLLLMAAKNPVSGKRQFFIEKNLSFGTSISCSHFQRFSNSLRHIVETKASRKGQITNYLNDYLCYGISREECDYLVQKFMEICQIIGVPIATEKTEWSTRRITFLGILLDGRQLCMAIPSDKRDKALKLVGDFRHKKSAMVHEIQVLEGNLNFLNKAIYPGRPFLRWMYAKYAQLFETNARLQKYHVKIDTEFKNDCWVWELFLMHQSAVCRPFIDIEDKMHTFKAKHIGFYTDTSKNSIFGAGGFFNGEWFVAQWELGYIRKFNPSIQYLELYVLCLGIFIWETKLQNIRIIVNCDNKTVRDAVNSLTSGCKNCMYLLRMLTLNNLRFNQRVFVKYVKSKDNKWADPISRMKLSYFLRIAPKNTKRVPEKLPEALWPASKVWQL